MLCVNGHEVRDADSFCPQCGSSSINSGKISISNEQLKPIVVDLDQGNSSTFQSLPTHNQQSLPPLNDGFGKVSSLPHQRAEKKYLPAIILISVVVIFGLIIGISTSKSTPPTTTTLPSGPSISRMESQAVQEFNQNYYYYRTGSYASCSYNPHNWYPGYSFNCEIFNSYSNYVGQVDITATSYPEGAKGAARWTYRSYPW